ncbi:MAG: lipocalin family protein [Chitinophagaceae bacterium]
MKKSILKVAVLAMVFGFFISCSKKKEDTTPTNPKVALIIGSDWKVSKYETKVNSDPFIDQYPTIAACTQDDRYVFRSDKSYEYNEGPTKCNAGQPQVIYTSTWSLSADGTKITIDGAESTIELLDDNTLIISGNYYTNPDINYYRTTFVH